MPPVFYNLIARVFVGFVFAIGRVIDPLLCSWANRTNDDE